MARCAVLVAERSARRRNEGVARETGHHLSRPLRAAGDSAARCPCPFPQRPASEFGLKPTQVIFCDY